MIDIDTLPFELLRPLFIVAHSILPVHIRERVLALPGITAEEKVLLIIDLATACETEEERERWLQEVEDGISIN